jgi:hypothetical protein
MHKILIIILAFFLSVSTCQKKIDKVVNDPTMTYVEDTLTRPQLDSLFIADTLSFNIEEDWIKSTVLNQEKTDLLYKYIYIKSLTDSTGTIYTLYSYQDTLYIINKRVVK